MTFRKIVCYNIVIDFDKLYTKELIMTNTKVSALLKKEVSTVVALERNYEKALKQIARLEAQVEKLKTKLGLPVANAKAHKKVVKAPVKKQETKKEVKVTKPTKTETLSKKVLTEKKAKLAKKIGGGTKKKKASIL